MNLQESMKESRGLLEGLQEGELSGIKHTVMKLVYVKYKINHTSWIQSLSVSQLELSVGFILFYDTFEQLKQALHK